VIREGVNTGQFLVHLVIADKEFDEDKRTLRLQFQEQVKQDEYLKKTVDTWIVSYNNGLADIIRTADTRTETRRGEGTIYEKLIFPGDNEQTRELNFRISPFSFFQTNTV
jgi:tRNA/tmRNA/rRNA uracil-C5-methylase (TrmA/RlmC/RlmD family)